MEIKPGTIISGFDIQVPASNDVCRHQIASSLRRGLPEAVSRRPLIVVANGPSARGIDLRSLKHPTLALNGAIRLFLEQGLEPTYWACCDTQALVADFLPEHPPTKTAYFVASKCHPSVFDKLRGRDVLLWHVADHPAEGRQRIALCSSVTLSASWLMVSQGFTDFEYYGWDGCFMDGRNHAAHNNPTHAPELHINYGGKVVDGEVIGGRTFDTTKTWAAEAQGAEQFFQLAKYFDFTVKLHGDGMFKCAQAALAGV